MKTRKYVMPSKPGSGDTANQQPRERRTLALRYGAGGPGEAGAPQ